MDYGPTPAVATPQPLYAVYIHGPNTIDFTPSTAVDYGATGGAGYGVPCGAVVVLGHMIGIAVVPLPAGVAGALTIKGVFKFPKTAGDGGMNAGTLAYWDASAHVATATAAGNNYLGKVELTAATADTEVKVCLAPLAQGMGSGTATGTGSGTGTGTGTGTGSGSGSGSGS